MPGNSAVLDAYGVLGCDQVQNYYFFRPVPPAALEEILAPTSW